MTPDGVMEGVIEGGWVWVLPVYLITWATWVAYAATLWLRRGDDL